MSFLGKVKKKLRNGSWYPFYNTFYEKNNLDPHMILLESRSGKALESNILSLLKELCQEPYRSFTLVLSVHRDSENEIKEKLEEIRKDQTESPYGMPNSIRREVQLTAEMCRYMREQIDTVFGAGSSQTIFGDVNVPTMFGEFFTLIGPCISSARSGAVKKYTAKKKATPK